MMPAALLACSMLAASPAPPAIFSTGFAGIDPARLFDRVNRADQISIAEDPADPDNAVLRIDVDAGDHYGGSLHMRFEDHLDEEPTRAYFRYRLWIDHSWTTTTGGKLPGFCGTYRRAGWGGKPSDGRNGWSARGLYGGLDDDGRVPIGSYIYHADMVEQGQTYGDSERWDIALERGRWYTIEQEIRLDTVMNGVGLANGRLRAWVDGELVYGHDYLHVRDTDDLRIESIWLNVYHGGKTPSPVDTHLLIDDLWVGHTRPPRPKEAEQESPAEPEPKEAAEP